MAGKNDWLRTASAFVFNSRSSFYVSSTVRDLADILYKWLMREGNTDGKANDSIYASSFTPMERCKLN